MKNKKLITISEQIQNMTLVEIGQMIRSEMANANPIICGPIVAALGMVMTRKFGDEKAGKMARRVGLLGVRGESVIHQDGRYKKLLKQAEKQNVGKATEW